jgi:integrase
MKRNRLYPGINRVQVRLSDGTKAVYVYAGKGGPRVLGKEGSAEFNKNWLEAMSARHDRTRAPADQLLSIFRRYQQSQEFRAGLSERTRADYAGLLTRKIEPRWGDFPVAGLGDKRTRQLIFRWRDELAQTSTKQADYAVTVLGVALAWAFDRGLVDINPATKVGKLYHGSRVEKVWSEEQEAAMLAIAPRPIAEALVLAVETGQRKGDLLRLPWSAYDGKHIRLQQSKRGRRVVIRVTRRLKRMLDAKQKRGPLILTNAKGHPWKVSSFDALWRRARAEAGIVGVTFHDLRGTAVTRLAHAGAELPEIASITGHSLGDVGRILDRHYLHRDQGLSDNAIAKLEARQREQKLPENFPNAFPNEPAAPSVNLKTASINQPVTGKVQRPIKRNGDPADSGYEGSPDRDGAPSLARKERVGWFVGASCYGFNHAVSAISLPPPSLGEQWPRQSRTVRGRSRS